VKQQLAAMRMLFDWLITGLIVPTNSAAVAPFRLSRAAGSFIRRRVPGDPRPSSSTLR
jgi:hypothetical protein